MKKIIAKDPIVNSDGVTNPELLFCDDALVVDYLNALLASEPALNIDFREIHFVHQEMNSSSKDNTLVGNSKFIESKFSKTEADILRSENESLKFKTELASIDAQVLRNENSKLKIEKERLVAELGEMKVRLNTVWAENESMRQTAETDRYRLDLPEIHIEDQTQDTPADSTDYAEMTTGENIAPDVEPADRYEISEQDIQPEPVALVEECRNDSKIKITVPVDQERSIISNAPVTNDFVKTGTNTGVTIFSRESASNGILRQNTQPFSTVIKHSSVEKNHIRQTDHTQKTASSDTVPREKYNNTADRSPDFMPQQHHDTEVADSMEADAPAAYAAAQRLNDTDEINMPSAPAPKVVIRRIVKNYEALQKESDAIVTSEAGHTIIL